MRRARECLRVCVKNVSRKCLIARVCVHVRGARVCMCVARGCACARVRVSVRAGRSNAAAAVEFLSLDKHNTN